MFLLTVNIDKTRTMDAFKLWEEATAKLPELMAKTGTLSPLVREF